MRDQRRTIDPEHMRKRDGKVVAFSHARIATAILNAGRATGQVADTEAAKLANKVCQALTREGQEYEDYAPHIEHIQNLVESTLIQAGYTETARKYIAYRDQRNRERESNKTMVDVAASVDEYLDRTDWRVGANANQGYSLGGLILNSAGKMTANYWLNHVYPPEVGSAHREGDIHIHDLDVLAGYCFAGGTKVALLDGTHPTLKELAETRAGESFWVYSRDGDGKVVPGLAHSPRLTRESAETVSVEISGGEKIRCTPDHQFMLRDGSYKEAQDLRQGDSLMPLYVSRSGNYLRIRDGKQGLCSYVHRHIASSFYQDDLTGKAVHHLNGDKHDNRPENLDIMDDAEHRAMEIARTRQTPEWKTANAARLAEYNQSSAKRGAVSEFAKGRERDAEGMFYNHTVRRIPQAAGAEEVYCLTVDKYENFALSSGVFVHNCAGWSLRTLLTEGLNGVPGRVEATPPKHMSSAVGQIVNFLGTLQNEWAGAQAFSSFDTYMAPYVRLDSLSYVQVKQHIQELIYNLNVPSRWGSQSPFTNLTFDMVCPDDLKDQVPVVGGKEVCFSYGDLQVEMDMINRAYIEVMTVGDAKGRVFTFPIPTYNITEGFKWEGETADMLFEMTAKYGTPYFQNFLNSDLKPNMVRSMCCRLQIDLGELLKRGNGLFGSAEQTGSLGVVTINCARLGYTAEPEGYPALLSQLDKLLDIAKSSLEIKRKVVQKHMDNGLFPYTKRYLGTLRNHFSTIGVNGINEMVQNYTKGRVDVSTKTGIAFAAGVLDHIRSRLAEFQEETGHMYNLEATPAEGTTYRFAREDQKRFPGIIQAGTPERPYYTNSSQLPVGHTDDPFEALTLQESLQGKYTGGTVLHLYLGERMESAEACKRLVKRSLTNFKVPYITVTPTFSICPTHGYIAGEHVFCPTCDEELLRKKSTKV